MLCKKPFRRGGSQYGCGQCTPCRINSRRLWQHRIMLESQCHESNAFVTLTYSPECYPRDGSVSVEEVQNWLKRLRERLRYYELPPIRHFSVGEYGEETSRAHYHSALFGYPTCVGSYPVRNTPNCDCPVCTLLRESWGKGGTLVGTLTLASAGYIAGYVTKKMTKADDVRLNGRAPEFARMSLRPGIGALAVGTVAAALNDSVGAAVIARDGDVPRALRHGMKSFPLGRYLRRKLREELGFDEIGQSEAQRSKQELERMLDVSSDPRGISARLEADEAERIARVRQMERRAQLFPKLEKL